MVCEKERWDAHAFLKIQQWNLHWFFEITSLWNLTQLDSRPEGSCFNHTHAKKKKKEYIILKKLQITRYTTCDVFVQIPKTELWVCELRASIRVLQLNGSRGTAGAAKSCLLVVLLSAAVNRTLWSNGWSARKWLVCRHFFNGFLCCLAYLFEVCVWVVVIVSYCDVTSFGMDQTCVSSSWYP